MSIFSIFISAEALIGSIIGLAIGILYVIIDTQIIIHKTENGKFEVFRDAKELFVDFIKIMIEILSIMSKLSGEKKKDNEKN